MCTDRDCGSCGKQARQAARLIALTFGGVLVALEAGAHIAGLVEAAEITLATVGCLVAAAVYVYWRWVRPQLRGQLPPNRLTAALPRRSRPQLERPSQTAEFHFHNAEAAEAFARTMRGEQ